MKNLTKVMMTLIIGVSVLGFSSCCEPADRHNRTIFNYLNHTDKTIYILPTSINMKTSETAKNEYVIGVGDTLSLIYTTNYYEYPFCQFLSDQANCKTELEIRNGKPDDSGVKIIQSSPEGSLFKLSNYTAIDEGTIKKYEFTFTDNFFKDGVPIE